MSNEKDDLEQLLKSAGWLRYEQHLKDYWQRELSTHIAAAADDREDAFAIQKIRQVIAAQKAVQQALAWPKERLARLTRPETATSMSRGGYVDPSAAR